MRIETISENISYIPASNNPLSSDVGIVHGNSYDWIFDVGNNSKAAEMINSLPKAKNVLLSHFHEDHMGNIDLVHCNKIYCGGYTAKKLQDCEIVDKEIFIDDGVIIRMFPIPSTHAKGCVGLEINEEYAFVGDALYSTVKNGQAVYNVSLLRETIVTLEKIKADKLLVSHDNRFIQDRDTYLKELNLIYSKRMQKEPYVALKDTEIE